MVRTFAGGPVLIQDDVQKRFTAQSNHRQSNRNPSRLSDPLTAHIHWEFVELRAKQKAEQVARETANIIAFALDGAPSGYYPTFGGDPDLIYYMTPTPISPWLDTSMIPPPDTEPERA